MNLVGDTSPLSVAAGFVMAVVGVVVFATRFVRRGRYRNPRWSDFANWGVFTLTPVFGLVLFGIYLIGVTGYPAGHALGYFHGR